MDKLEEIIHKYTPTLYNEDEETLKQAILKLIRELIDDSYANVGLASTYRVLLLDNLKKMEG